MLKKRGRKALKQQEQTTFLSELSELVHAGYSLPLSLAVIQSGHLKWRSLLETVQNRLAEGHDLTRSLSGVLSPTLISYLALAQQHGHFEETLAVLVDKLQQLLGYQRQLKQIMTYPVFLVLLLFGMVYGLEHTLYPIFSELAGNAGQGAGGNFPLTALHVLLASVVLTGILGFMFYIYLLKLPPLRRLLTLARLPGVAGFTKDLMTAMMAEQLAIFLKAGMTLPEIIEYFATESAGKRSLGQELAKNAQFSLANAEDLTTWLRKQIYLRPGISAYLTRGFEPGILSAYLAFYAKREYQSFHRRVHRSFSLIQPLLFAIIGLTIVLLYLAMLLPLYQNLGGYQP